MKLLFVDDPTASRRVGVGYTQEMLDAVRAGCDMSIECPQTAADLDRFGELVVGGGYMPLFLLLGSEAALKLWYWCLNEGADFVLVDHPNDGEQRFKMVRLAVNGIYAPYKEGAPVWRGRTYDWDLQPWRKNQPKQILYCPSAQDCYGQYLQRDETDEPNFAERLHKAQAAGLIDPDWLYKLRKRFEDAWAERHQSARPNGDQAILASGAVALGNSEIGLKSLRLGVPAFIDHRPDLPLANPLATYAPIPIECIDFPAIWQIPREPLFAQLAMTQCTIGELADRVILRMLIAWQLEHLF